MADRVTSRSRWRAAIARSNGFPLTDDHFDLSQARDKALLTIAYELFSRLTSLRLVVRTIRMISADRPEILRAMDMIDREIARIASLAEDMIAATSFQAKGLPT
ncbi:hypothetical protein [Paraburkholderia sediminicola]|uniref:hypothetical protein n=1 Tax=Paraburkholderia sediminicola TaxID=458836 RepID=UPI0038B80769